MFWNHLNFRRSRAGSCSPRVRFGILTGSSTSSTCRQICSIAWFRGSKPEKVRDTQGGNGTTFDLQGRLLNCEGDARRVARIEHDGTVTTLADRFKGKRLSRPNDVICHSNGSILFTDPDFRVPLEHREIGHAAVYRVAPDGAVSEVVRCEYPNGLALSRDERTLFVANTRWTQYIHAVELDSSGHMVRRRVFADMSADGTNGVPDGMKIDEAGRVFCTGTGGVWVFEPDGTAHRYHRNARGMREHRLWRPGFADLTAHCNDLGLYFADEGARIASPLV